MVHRGLGLATMIIAAVLVPAVGVVVVQHAVRHARAHAGGEPLATAMGRDLAGYSRDALPADVYFEPDGFFWIDLAGFSSRTSTRSSR